MTMSSKAYSVLHSSHDASSKVHTVLSILCLVFHPRQCTCNNVTDVTEIGRKFPSLPTSPLSSDFARQTDCKAMRKRKTNNGDPIRHALQRSFPSLSDLPRRLRRPCSNALWSPLLRGLHQGSAATEEGMPVVQEHDIFPPLATSRLTACIAVPSELNDARSRTGRPDAGRFVDLHHVYVGQSDGL